MWKAFDEEAERSDRYTRTAYFAEEFRSQSGISTKKKRNAFQMCGQSEFVHYDDGVQSLYGNGTVSDEDENGSTDEGAIPETPTSKTIPSFEDNDALHIIASIFVYNNISDALGRDIFLIGNLLTRFHNISLSEVLKKKRQWGKHDSHVYAFCAKCEKILMNNEYCRNDQCSRYQLSQANASEGKKLITYSIRSQIEDLIRNGCFNAALLSRSTVEPSLTSRISSTPKYIDKIKKSERERPGIITLFLSFNTDGFKKKGLARGDIWPIYVVCHDLNLGSGAFHEFAAEFVLLAAVTQSAKPLERSDFLSAFERFRSEIETSHSDPLSINLNGRTLSIVLDVYEGVLDMDASRKLHGVPQWTSYNGCSRCDIQGISVKTKNNGNFISWHSLTPVNIYNDNSLPPKLKRTCLPPPYDDGFDALHLIAEGSSRDILNDILKNGNKISSKLSADQRKKWTEALDNAKLPRGMCSTTLLTPLHLTFRTGSEIQKLFDLSLPVLLMSTDSLEKWAIGCYIMWLITRVITDWHLTNSICDKLNSIIDDVRYVLRTHFKEFMTMKVHFSLEHLVPDLKYRGSPMLTSAAPFERLNQTLGRHTNVYTTRTLSDMATRFMSLQRALYLVRSAIYKPDCPVDFPTTLRHAIREDVPTACLLKYDHNPLSEEEQFFIDNSEHRIVHMRSEVRLESRTYKTRRQCDSDLAKSCYVYFIKHTGHTQFGSIERILLNDDGVKMVLLQEFETIDPFMNLLNTFHSEISNAKVCSELNSYFLQVIGTNYVIIPLSLIKGYCTIVEFNQKSFVSRM